MSEMLDRIARAIDPAAFAEHPDMGAKNWNNRRRLALSRARRAVEAMREPTGAMLTAEGVDVIGSAAPLDGYLDYFEADGVWKAMIEEILK